jgi:hypothetical protein
MKYILSLRDWFFEKGDGTSLYILRKLIALVALAKLLLNLPNLSKWFSNDGWLSRDTAFFASGQEMFFSVLRWLPDNFVYFLTAMLFVSIFCMLFDFKTKWANIFLAIGMVSLDNRDTFVCNGFDRLLRILIIYLAFADGNLRQKRPVELWPQRLIQIQIAIMYLSTVAFKYLDSEAWRSGYAVRLVLNYSQYRWIPLPDFVMKSAIPEFINYGSLIIETLLGSLVFWKRATKPVLVAGIFFHLGITAFTSIPLFNLTAIFSYSVFVRGEEWDRFLNTLKQFISKKVTYASAVLAVCLLASGCALRPDPFRLNSELYTAAQYGHTSLVEYLISRGAKADWYSNGNTTLTIAAINRHWDTVNVLIKSGASLKTTDVKGNSLLHIAAMQEDASEIKTLIHAGLRVDALNQTKSTPLHLAAIANSVKAVRALLEEGSNINAQNNYLETPLHVAAWKGNKAVFDYLIERGAKTDLKTIKSQTIQDYLTMTNHRNLHFAALGK